LLKRTLLHLPILFVETCRIDLQETSQILVWRASA
jgi:hypothetical protein